MTARGRETPRAEIVMVLDARHMIYVSTRPTEFPMLGNPAYLDPEYASVKEQVAQAATGEPTAIVTPGSGKLYMVLPILADGVELGTLVVAESRVRLSSKDQFLETLDATTQINHFQVDRNRRA